MTIVISLSLFLSIIHVLIHSNPNIYIHFHSQPTSHPLDLIILPHFNHIKTQFEFTSVKKRTHVILVHLKKPRKIKEMKGETKNKKRRKKIIIVYTIYMWKKKVSQNERHNYSTYYMFF